MSGKVEITCDWCGKTFMKLQNRITLHNFCSRACLAAFSSKRKNPAGYKALKDYRNISLNMSELNSRLNPSRMTPEVKAKLRIARLGTGGRKGYEKTYGVHTHRVVMEQVLGRKLRAGEVVHHIDGNRRNNSPENLMVFESQAEHQRYHVRMDKFFSTEGGDSE